MQQDICGFKMLDNPFNTTTLTSRKRIHSSKNLQFIEFDMVPKKWNELNAFFKMLQVNYIEPD